MTHLPMGLSISLAVWMQFITKVMTEIQTKKDQELQKSDPNMVKVATKHHLAVMDDIIVHSKMTDHVTELICLFKVLIKYGLKISPKKCQFFRKCLTYMGHDILMKDGRPCIQAHKSRIDAIKAVKTLTMVKEARGFCGMANFLGMYIKDLAKMLAPIYNLTRKGVKFEWTEECQKSFEAVKQAMSEAPVLVLPNQTGLFQLQSDTSKTGCGGALFQVQDGVPRLLGYYSRKLPPVCARYGITELEMTGMTAVITAFHHLLSHVYFEVYMDHSAIVYIMKAKDELRTDCMARLLEILQKYSFVVKYQKGQDMWIADFLSRVAQKLETDGIIPILFDAARSLIAPMEVRSMWWAREQAEQATPSEPAVTSSPETTNQNTAEQPKQTERLGLEPERSVIDTLLPPQDATMLWPTTPVVRRPIADPKMQQIAEMLWERLKQDPGFEALEA